ncbi:DUF5129 domain-containing protein [Glutamicibacter bergerei]
MHQPQSTGLSSVAVAARRTVAAGFAATLLMASVIPGAYAVAAEPDTLESITVDDTANVLNEDKLRDAIEGLDFNEPTKVAVYTRNGEYSDDINTKTLDFARSSHSEWISDKPEDYGDYWADGYFIITLSVEGQGDGQVGTYFGEDRKVSEGQMGSIHEAGYEDFNAGRWSDGVIAVAERGSKIMNRPWYQHPALGWTVGLGGLGALGTVGITAAVRAHNRKRFGQALGEGTEHLTRVTLDLDATELAASTLPADAAHATVLASRFANFSADYRVVFSERQELEATTKKLRSRSVGVLRAKDFLSTAQTLDLTDDAIIDAASLYTRDANWEAAWRRQIAPLLEDLNALPELTENSTDAAEGGDEEVRASVAALNSFAAQARNQLQRLGDELKSESIEVDDALDALSDLRVQLTEKLDALANAQIVTYAKSPEEEEEMRTELKRSRYDATNQRPRAVGTILDVSYPAAMYWSVGSYSTGYSQAVSSVDSSRSSGGSSGVSQGYSGGGSFSGAGGSSHF